MIECFNKEEFMKAPVFTTIEYAVCDEGDREKPLLLQEEPGIILHIGDRDYDVRDLVYRLLRAEGEVMVLMEKVADLQGHVQVLKDKMDIRDFEIDNNSKLLDDFLKGEWKIRFDR